MGTKRGSLWGAIIGAAVLIGGAAFGLPRLGASGVVWTVVGAVLLGYNVWALLRRSGKAAPREFPMPDPEQQKTEQAQKRAQLDELERQYRAHEIGYETYVRRRMEIVTGQAEL